MAKIQSKPKGRRTIRRQQFGNDQPSRYIGLWDLAAEPGSTLATLESAYLAGLNAIDTVEARKASGVASGKFTEAGLKADVLAFALNNVIGPLHKARTTIGKAKAELAERKSKLTIQQPDKTDIAAALLRQEIRAHLRAMPQTERDKYLVGNLDNLPPVVAEAILTAPPELSGIAETHRALLTEKALEAQHPGEVAQVSELQRAIEVAERAVEIARDEVRIEAGVMDPNEFDAMAAPIEQRHKAPWLRKQGDEIRVVDLERKVERVASPEEIEAGVYYENAQAYERGQAAQTHTTEEGTTS
jgi:hypothetical protein